jgi:NAD(P)-dependent dehydrogenase (short-subunit alcohol dehydrogenase family)
MNATPATHESAAAPELVQRDAVLVTGASTGIGAATAVRLARGGMLVFANVRRAEDGQRLQHEAGANVRPLVFDVTDPEGIERARRTVAAEPGIVLRAVINNAGIGLAGPLELMPLEDIRKTMEVNYIAPLAIAKAFLPLLRESRGRLINVTSAAGKFASPFGGAYAASKFALEAASDALRVELASFGIPVIVVEPGSVKTPFWDRGVAAGEAMMGQVPSASLALYQSNIDSFRAFLLANLKNGAEPDRIATVIQRALVARNPRARYIAGDDVRIQMLLARLPEALRDALVRRALGLNGR